MNIEYNVLACINIECINEHKGLACMNIEYNVLACINIECINEYKELACMNIEYIIEYKGVSFHEY